MRHLLYLCLLGGVALATGSARAQTRLLRYPDLHGDDVVFCYAGDLWTAPVSGGSARRLTAHPGQELFPKYSPDGRWIAFTGQYDGDEQVYVMPAAGGAPRQLTFYPARGPLPPRWGSDNQVYGFTPDGGAVLFRSMREGWDLGDTRLYTVPVTGGLPAPLPMPVSGAGDYSPDGMQVVYSPLVRDFRSWKRYQGGWAQDLFLFDLATYEIREVAHHPRTERDPMWIGDRIYFASDRSGTLNLYSFDISSGEVRALTDSNRWDVRWASKGDQGRIIFELQGELQVLDTASGETRALSILVPTDDLGRRPGRTSAADDIEGFALSPGGERALFWARGDVFTAPIENGPTRNLTRSSGAHDKWAAWSPDGSQVAFLSDRTGEEELHVVAQDGAGETTQLTEGGQAMRYDPKWSADGKRIAFSDKDGRLQVLEVETRTLTEVADEQSGFLRDYEWSPRGGRLAYALSSESGFDSIHIWSADTGESRRVTDERFHQYSPTWDPEGNYLFFLSDREFAPQIGSFEWNYVVNRSTSIHALALRKDVLHPFPPRSDEVSRDEAKPDAAPHEAAAGEAEPLKIDFDGIEQRVARVPVEADNYSHLRAAHGVLFYQREPAFYYGREGDFEAELKVFSREKREEKTFATAVDGFELSFDGKHVLVLSAGNYSLHDATFDGGDSKKAVSTAGLQVDRVPAEEFRQIYHEVWRRFRDFFYAPNMHGYDWDALRRQYEGLLDHVAHRSDLNYVISELIGELNVSHAYISGGDYEVPPRPQVALAGCSFALDAGRGLYRIDRILAGQNEEPRYRSPLTEIGVDARAGDYLLAIDGIPLGADDNPYERLRYHADRAVTFSLSATGASSDARDVLFQPISTETSLRYLGWVEANRRRVTEATEGRVGYLHLPDMGADGIREFIKWFYPQIRKEGLVIDVRGNGGGNVSQMLIERLGRELLGTEYPRTSERTDTYPEVVFHGHLVCVLNETSASDGDIFPWMFQAKGLGPLVGKRSWGGVIGISDRGPLLDGGSVSVPEFGHADRDGQWAVEGYGVDPDIVVENDPRAVIEGRDPQLDRSIEEVMRAIEREPRRLPGRPADPVRTR